MGPGIGRGSYPSGYKLYRRRREGNYYVVLRIAGHYGVRYPIYFTSTKRSERGKSVPVYRVRGRCSFLVTRKNPFGVRLSKKRPAVESSLPRVVRVKERGKFAFFRLGAGKVQLTERRKCTKGLGGTKLGAMFLRFSNIASRICRALHKRTVVRLGGGTILGYSRTRLNVTLIPIVTPKMGSVRMKSVLGFNLSRVPFIHNMRFRPVDCFNEYSRGHPRGPVAVPGVLELVRRRARKLVGVRSFTNNNTRGPCYSFRTDCLEGKRRRLGLLRGGSKGKYYYAADSSSERCIRGR